MKRLLLTTACLIPLAGCGIAAQVQTTHDRDALRAGIAACKAQKAAANWSYTQLSQCFIGPENAFAQAHPRNSDLLAVFQAQRQILAGKVDRGEMPAEQGALQVAEARAAMVGESGRRDNETGFVNAAQTSANAQLGIASTYELSTGLRLLQGHR